MAALDDAARAFLAAHGIERGPDGRNRIVNPWAAGPIHTAPDGTVTALAIMDNGYAMFDARQHTSTIHDGVGTLVGTVGLNGTHEVRASDGAIINRTTGAVDNDGNAHFTEEEFLARFGQALPPSVIAAQGQPTGVAEVAAAVQAASAATAAADASAPAPSSGVAVVGLGALALLLL